MKLSQIFKSLQQKEFAKLYAGQTISLLGDAFTWVGIALLAFEFAGEKAAGILSIALTLRVTAFILFAPYAGVLADKVNRKKILLISDFGRMLIVLLLVFVNAEWQLYVLIFLLNVFSAFFTPAFKASVPQMIKDKERFAPAIALSNATYQLLAIMGPGLAGMAAAWLGTREIFIIDSFTFLFSALFILFISRHLFQLDKNINPVTTTPQKFREVLKGTQLLFADKIIRFALLVELAAAIAGACILVNTIGYVKGILQQGDKQYGMVMSALGIGAVIGAFGSAIFDKSKGRKISLLVGGIAVSVSLLPVAFTSSLWLLMLLWLVAGFGQNLAEIPSQMLIAERIPLEQQGRVYGAHFAWSHVWWAIGYPIAGFLGTQFSNISFLVAGCISLSILFIIFITHYSKKRTP